MTDIDDGITETTLTLDRDAHYGTIFPPDENGAVFLQNDFHFDGQGKLVLAALTDGDRARLKRMQARKGAAQAAETARRKSLEAAGLDPDQPADPSEIADLPRRTPAGNASGAPASIDLVAWAQGKVPLAWHIVRDAAEQQFGYDARDKRALIEFMLDNGKISQGEVRAV